MQSSAIFSLSCFLCVIYFSRGVHCRNVDHQNLTEASSNNSSILHPKIILHDSNSSDSSKPLSERLFAFLFGPGSLSDSLSNMVQVLSASANSTLSKAAQNVTVISASGQATEEPTSNSSSKEVQHLQSNSSDFQPAQQNVTGGGFQLKVIVFDFSEKSLLNSSARMSEKSLLNSSARILEKSLLNSSAPIFSEKSLLNSSHEALGEKSLLAPPEVFDEPPAEKSLLNVSGISEKSLLDSSARGMQEKSLLNSSFPAEKSFLNSSITAEKSFRSSVGAVLSEKSLLNSSSVVFSEKSLLLNSSSKANRAARSLPEEYAEEFPDDRSLINSSAMILAAKSLNASALLAPSAKSFLLEEPPAEKSLLNASHAVFSEKSLLNSSSPGLSEKLLFNSSSISKKSLLNSSIINFSEKSLMNSSHEHEALPEKSLLNSTGGFSEKSLLNSSHEALAEKSLLVPPAVFEEPPMEKSLLNSSQIPSEKSLLNESLAQFSEKSLLNSSHHESGQALAEKSLLVPPTVFEEPPAEKSLLNSTIFSEKSLLNSSLPTPSAKLIFIGSSAIAEEGPTEKSLLNTSHASGLSEKSLLNSSAEHLTVSPGVARALPVHEDLPVEKSVLSAWAPLVFTVPKRQKAVAAEKSLDVPTVPLLQVPQKPPSNSSIVLSATHGLDSMVAASPVAMAIMAEKSLPIMPEVIQGPVAPPHLISFLQPNLIGLGPQTVIIANPGVPLAPVPVPIVAR